LRSIAETTLRDLIDTVIKDGLNINTASVQVVYDDVLYERDPNLSDEEELERYERRLNKNLVDFKIKPNSTIFIEASFSSDPEGEPQRKINVQLLEDPTLNHPFTAQILKKGIPKAIPEAKEKTDERTFDDLEEVVETSSKPSTNEKLAGSKRTHSQAELECEDSQQKRPHFD
jgi:hypothetical protein